MSKFIIEHKGKPICFEYEYSEKCKDQVPKDFTKDQVALFKDYSAAYVELQEFFVETERDIRQKDFNIRKLNI